MEKKLKTILQKLSEARDGSVLTVEDFDYFSELTKPIQVKVGGPRPLWYWVRKQALQFAAVFDFDTDSEMDPILEDAGAPSEQINLDAWNARKGTRVTREGLERAVRRHLTNESTGTRAHAARLVGFAEMTEIAPLLVDSLESGREERQSWGMPVITASIEALAMLHHPQAPELAAKYVGHDDHMLARAAEVCVLLGEGDPPREALEKLFSGSFDYRILPLFGDAFNTAAQEGIFAPNDLERMMGEMYLNIDTCVAIADIVVSNKWEETFAKLIEHDDRDIRAALGVRVAWSDNDWATGPINARLADEEHDEEVQTALIAALGSFGGDYKSMIRSRISADSNGEQCGAAYGAIGQTDLNEDIEPLLRDEDGEVRRAVSCVLAVNQADPVPDLIELKWTELLNLDAWWPWAVPLKGIKSTKMPLPASTQVFETIAHALPMKKGAVDRALELCQKHPHQLMRWLESSTPDNQRSRAIALAGLMGGEVAHGALEQHLMASQDSDSAMRLYLELLCFDEPISEEADIKGRMALYEKAEFTEDTILPAVAFAHYASSEVRERAIKSLSQFGKQVEPFLSMLLSTTDTTISQAAATAASQLHDPSDPLLVDIGKLMSSEVRQIDELTMLDRLVSCPSNKVRANLAEVAGLPDNDPKKATPYLLQLAVDKDEEVAAAAMGALALQAGDALWVKELVLRQTWSDYWMAKEKATAAMAQIADPIFIERLLELSKEDDYTVMENAVRGLDRIAEEHPSEGLVILDIRQPDRVRTRFGLNERIDYDADEKSEALRLLLLGLDRRKDEGEAKKQKGRNVMLSPAASSESSGMSRWTLKEFETLAIYLTVTYTDEDSGTIVAEVGTEPTGEVLSALLQSASVTATVVSWS